MARVKRGVIAHRRHKKILKKAKGYYNARRKVFRVAKQAVIKAGQYAYIGRRLKKRQYRALWIQRLNAAAREHGLSYSRLINGLNKAGVTIGPIMDTEMLDSDPYAIEREALIEVPDADMPGGWLPMHGMVPRLSGTPGILARPAPKLGEHNAEVLEAALGTAHFQKLREGGVIRG